MTDVATAVSATTWEPVDLMPVLSGSRMPILPAIGSRNDGVRLLYPGRVHTLAGESEAGKSLLSLALATELLNTGSQVVYVDLEDDESSHVQRLLAMGVPDVTIASHFVYVRPERRFDSEAAAVLRPVLAAATLVIVDAVTEVMNLHGLKPKDDVDVAAFLDLLPRPMARLGPAVLLLDHVVKDPEARGRWATGSQHKLAGVDGAAFILEAVSPFGRGLAGKSRLLVAKDRHGGIRRHTVKMSGNRHWLADFAVAGRPDGSIVTALHAPEQRPEDWRPTEVMTKVSAALAKAGQPLSQRAVLDRVSGRAEVVRQGLAALVDDGYVLIETGPRNAALHRLIRPFPEVR